MHICVIDQQTKILNTTVMNIIPVIDLKDGLVVSAQQGKRHAYQPIHSTLCASSLIEDVLTGFLSVYPFKTLYIADLNAISHQGNNQKLINDVISNNPSITFWVDNGIQIQQLPSYDALKYKPVIGSESQNTTHFPGTTAHLINTILSLDFFPEKGYTGPAELLNNASLWPQHIILMALERVGKDRGPDIERLSHFCRKHPEKDFIAAGGIRHEHDLLQLEKTGVHHALIASALHSGVINTLVIEKLQAKKMPRKNITEAF